MQIDADWTVHFVVHCRAEGVQVNASGRLLPGARGPPDGARHPLRPPDSANYRWQLLGARRPDGDLGEQWMHGRTQNLPPDEG